MADMPSRRFARGETIQLALAAGTDADVATVTEAKAYLRKVGQSYTELKPNDPDAIEMQMDVRAATVDVEAGWDIMHPSDSLEIGLYVADCRLESGSGVQITDSIHVDIYESASSETGA